MANVKISALPAATSSTGPDLLVIDQGGTTKQITNTAFLTSATLTTPVLGVATATSLNKVTVTAPATAATLTIADNKTLTASNSLTLAGIDGKTVTHNATTTFAGTDGKTLTVSNSMTLAGTDGRTLTLSKSLTVSNSLTLAGTDSTTMTFPSTSATIARTDAAQTFTGNQAITGSLTFSAALVGSVQTLSGPGAVDLTTLTTRFTSTAAGNALTLADGTDGQIKMIVYYAEAAGANTGILTPTNLGAATTVTFNAVGDTALLQFLGTDWWVIAVRGAVVA